MKQRRVGTFTLALVLIFLGIAIPLALFGGSAYSGLLKFAPLALVSLGIEIVIAAIVKKDDKLTYDGFSIFLTIVVTVITIFSATVVPFITKGIEYGKEYNRYTNEYINSVEGELYDNGIVADVWAYNDLDFFEYLEYNEGDFKDGLSLVEATVNINYSDDKIVDEETVKNDFVKAMRIAAKDEKVKNVRVNASDSYDNENISSSLSASLEISTKRINTLSDEEIKSQIRLEKEDRQYDDDVSSDEVVSSEAMSSEMTGLDESMPELPEGTVSSTAE